MKDLTNQKHGRLTVLRIVDKNKQGSYRWLCLCDCGKEKIIVGYDIRRGMTTSCGCYATERRKANNVGLGIAGRNEIYSAYKRSAHKKDIPFTLSMQDFVNISAQSCYYCGIIPNQNHNNFIYNGMDRLESAKGYTLDNVVSSCGICNRAKYTMTELEFRGWLHRICKYQNINLE